MERSKRCFLHHFCSFFILFYFIFFFNWVKSVLLKCVRASRTKAAQSTEAIKNIYMCTKCADSAYGKLLHFTALFTFVSRTGRGGSRISGCGLHPETDVTEKKNLIKMSLISISILRNERVCVLRTFIQFLSCARFWKATAPAWVPRATWLHILKKKKRKKKGPARKSKNQRQFYCAQTSMSWGYKSSHRKRLSPVSSDCLCICWCAFL